MSGIADEQRPVLGSKAAAARPEQAYRAGADRCGEAIGAGLAAEHHPRPGFGEKAHARTNPGRARRRRLEMGRGERDTHGFSVESLTSTRAPVTRTAWDWSCTSGAVRHSPLASSY